MRAMSQSIRVIFPVGRGLDKEQFRRLLQSWCVQNGCSLRVVGAQLLTLLNAPDALQKPEVRSLLSPFARPYRAYPAAVGIKP